MKKTTSYRLRIVLANLVQFTTYAIAVAIMLALAIRFDLGLGRSIILSLLLGAVAILPIAIREDNIIRHFKRMLDEEKRGE